MRRKRHKATRRALRFFRINHGFREPYKVRFTSSVEPERGETHSMLSGHWNLEKNHFLFFSRPVFSLLSLIHSQVLLDGNFVHALRETQ